MVSRPRPRLSKGLRLPRLCALWALALTIIGGGCGAALAQAPLNQPAAAYTPSLLEALMGKITGQQEAERRTRFVVDLEKPVPYRLRTLDNPRRVVIELSKVGIRLPAVPPGGHGLIKHLRAGGTTPSHTSIVVEVTDPVVIERAAMTPAANGSPARLEVILAPLDEGTRRAAIDTSARTSLGARVQPPVPQPASTATPPSAYRPLVVIDPGHGGRDSGARKFGVNEKDVVLAFSLVLRDFLVKTGRYRVVMTRDKDIFLTLDRRREIAEENGAALFIAVHADYAQAKARGATIYSLRKRVANRLRAEAANEAAQEAVSDGVMKSIAAKPKDLGALKGILGDLAQREVHVNLERTNVFTQLAIARMGAATTMRSQPHREAAFAVLKTAKVPSVLIELAYVSNRRDAARLQSSKWRREVAGSLVKAVDEYFAQSLSQIPQ